MPDENRSQREDPNATAAREPSDAAGTEPPDSESTRPQNDALKSANGARSQRVEVPGYELIEEVGHGGMGVVWRARDMSLNRDVAVKLLQNKFPAESGTARRFLEEAQITGQLQHPGIPAVHQVGTLPNGRPFLSMKLIKGRSLAQLIGEKSPINVLAIFEQMAQAVGFAHSHRVIHRDLKPANVMVGAFGEVQVMDWGLAKVLVSGGRLPAGSPSPEEPEVHIDRDSEHHTRDGSAMGTIAYMAPEQARGEVEEIDERSDVFGLGGVLCAMLTGQPLYRGGDWKNLHDQAAAGNLTDALTRLDASGADPEAIALCKRCLAVAKAERPANGAAVAEQVAKLRAAADERAKQAEIDRGKAEVQAAEQRKRRRVLGYAATAVGLVLALGIAISAWQWNRAVSEQQNTARALGEVKAEQEKTLAANEELKVEKKNTVDALNTMTDDVVEKLFGAQQQLDETQKEFLRKVIKLYEQVTASRGDSPESRSLVADGHHRVARIQQYLHLFPEAEANCRTACILHKSLMEQFPGVPTYKADLASSHNSLGALLQVTGRSPSAETEHRTASVLFKSLVERFPTMPAYQVGLASSHNNLGVLLRDIGRSADAETEYRAARLILSVLVDTYPAVQSHKAELASNYNNVGVMLLANGRGMAAENELRTAINLQKMLVEEFPDRWVYKDNLASSQYNLGRLLQISGRNEVAEVEYRDVRVLYKSLTDKFPAVPVYKNDLANVYLNHGVLKQITGRSAGAEMDYRAACELRKSLVEQFPTVLLYTADLAGCHTNLGLLFSDLGKGEAAEKEFRIAYDLQKSLVVHAPRMHQYRSDLAGTAVNWAILLYNRKQYSVARQLLEEVEVNHRAALSSEPLNPVYRQFFRNNRVLLLNCLMSLEDHSIVLAASRTMVEFSANRQVDNYDAACFVSRAISLLVKDMTLNDDTRKITATVYGDEAMNFLKQSIAQGYADHWHIKSDSDLDPIRSRPDFQKLVAELAKKYPVREPAPMPRPSP